MLQIQMEVTEKVGYLFDCDCVESERFGGKVSGITLLNRQKWSLCIFKMTLGMLHILKPQKKKKKKKLPFYGENFNCLTLFW